jgi:hypothetical protein
MNIGPNQTLNGLRSNAKPTESDMEEEDDDDEDDEDDPASWFEDDPEEDGRKGQNIIEPDGDPDEEDLSHLIRVDDHKLRTVYGKQDFSV